MKTKLFNTNEVETVEDAINIYNMNGCLYADKYIQHSKAYALLSKAGYTLKTNAANITRCTELERV